MKNITIKQLETRKSIRNFTGESVSDEDLQTIFKCAQRCPTSVNGQQISLIYTRDKEKIAQIAKMAGGQPQVQSANVFVTFVIDFNRTNYACSSIGKKQVIHQSAEGIIVGVVDAGIMLSSLQTAAEALGYGTTAIGGIRANIGELIKLLELPSLTFPIVGTTIGVATKEAKEALLKPRVPMESFVFEDVYDDKKVKEGVDQYEKDLKKFRDENHMDYLSSYKEQTAKYYENIYFRQIKVYFEQQGFKFKD